MVSKNRKKVYYSIITIAILTIVILFSNSRVFGSEKQILLNDTNIETKAISKYIPSHYVVYNAKLGNMYVPPTYYYYNDGQFRGNLTLFKWYDEKETTGLFKCYYRGTVYNGPAPGSKLLIPKIILPS